MDHDGLLTEFYTNKLSFGPALYYARDPVGQIAHRFQSMDVIEIGKSKKQYAKITFLIVCCISLSLSCYSS